MVAAEWPRLEVPPNYPADEADEICLVSAVTTKEPVIPFDRYSRYVRIR